MKKLFSTALLALVAAVTVNAQFLFRVKGKGLEQPSYILGYIHTLPGSLLDSIPEYLEAEAACKQLYAEYAEKYAICSKSKSPGLLSGAFPMSAAESRWTDRRRSRRKAPQASGSQAPPPSCGGRPFS